MTSRLQSRRSFLSAGASILAAPAIIRTPGLLMPISRTPLAVGMVISGTGIPAGTIITASASVWALSEITMMDY